MYKLRPYQQEAVDATLQHFRREKSPAVIVLPTGAGKSLVIAELARLAKGRVLVLAHVRELVEQNHAKYMSFGLEAGIFSAGLDRKERHNKVIFGSIQSVARAPEEFFQDFSLLVIDECHRVSVDGETQYFQVISKLQKENPDLCILGLTATPYRMGLGWIYQVNTFTKTQQTTEERFFKKCIFELSLRYMIKNNFLTPPIKIDSPVACYDFSSLKLNGDRFVTAQVEALLKDQKRITPLIIQNIIDMAKDRKGVMIFTSSVNHAIEIMKCLPPFVAALVVGDTEDDDRDEIIEAFKQQKLKYLVNVSVLTTGFDAPHVDVIAILRPTESVSLYQQIVGRGLRLSPGKTDCLILDYTGQGHDLFSPEIDDNKPNSESVAVEVSCPQCGHMNDFWGLIDREGELMEHFGRKCKGILEDPVTQETEACGFRFRFKVCDQCGGENDIAARQCSSCQHILIDNDKKLKEAMSLKDAHVMRVDSMSFERGRDKKGTERLEIKYYDFNAECLTEYFYLNSSEDSHAFYFNFVRMHNRLPERKIFVRTIDDVLGNVKRFRQPMFVVARKQKYFWAIREKIFE
jgi:DNA repair protein RadD